MGLTHNEFGNIPTVMSANPAFKTPQAAFAAAARRIGQTRLGELSGGRTQGAVSKRLAAGKLIWDTGILAVEAETGISRHDLRPDLYPREDGLAQPPVGNPSPAPGGSSSAKSAIEGLQA